MFASLAAAGFACVDLCCFTTGVLMFGVAAAGGTGAGSCMAGVSWGMSLGCTRFLLSSCP